MFCSEKLRHSQGKSMFWVIVIGVAVVMVLAAMGKSTMKKGAKDAYEKSLADLTADPNNAALRKATLTLGRTYANLTRDQKGVTIFDEVALMNDINAACGASAAAGQAESSGHRLAKLAPSLHQRLKQLEDLKQQGLVSEPEYAAKRNELLAEI
jgi:hypothetical protein